MSPEDEADLRRLILVEFRRGEYVAATCRGKEAFASFAMADQVAKAVTGRHGHGIMAYRCHVCSAWHVGSRKSDSPMQKVRNKERKGRQEAYS